MREIEIPLASLGHLTGATTLHFILDGRRWGSTDTPRISVHVGAV